jgi:5-methyltetrahydropteroyltriglutamate--homocysteine methyltransferase
MSITRSNADDVDAAKLLQRNFIRLAEAGCKHIQVDEPCLTPPSDEEVQSAVEAINL